MALPANELWAKIQKELSGRTNPDQIAVLKKYLSSWPEEWKGPYRDLKTKLVKLVARLETTEAVKSSGERPDPFYVKRQGDGQIAVVGLTNSGKSAIVSTLTSAHTLIADYPFATQTPVPGMFRVLDAAIQLIDTPPIVPNLSDGEGSGQRLLQLIRASNAIVMVVDLSEDDPISQVTTIQGELATGNLLTIAHPLRTVLHLKGKDGISFRGSVISKEEQLVARTLLIEAGVSNAVVVLRDHFSPSELSAQLARKTLLPTIIAANKNDMPRADIQIETLRQAFKDYEIIDVTCLDEASFDRLKPALFSALALLRIFVLAKPSPEATRVPMIVPRPSTVADVAANLDGARKDARDLTARVWGSSVKHAGQIVAAEHLLVDDDFVYLQ